MAYRQTNTKLKTYFKADTSNKNILFIIVFILLVIHCVWQNNK